MDERFDVDGVLRDVLEVLRRHNIPIQTAALNVSLLDGDFDEHFPQLKSYKAGHFRRPQIIDGVPLLVRAQRRYPFDEIVRTLESEIRPQVEALAETLRAEYPELRIAFASTNATQSPAFPHSLYLHSYRLGITCQFSDDAHADYNELDLAIFLQQRNATEYPRLTAWVGWLVDEESGGDWGVDVLYQSFDGRQDYAPHQLDMLRKALPIYVQRVRNEIARTLSGQDPWVR